MVIEPDSTGTLTFGTKQGIKTVINAAFPYSYSIELNEGTIIEGTTIINNPLAITPGDDFKHLIKTINLTITGNDTRTLRLVDE